MEIPLDDIGLNESDVADFMVVDGVIGRGLGAYPRDMFITIERDTSEQLALK